MAPIIVHVNFNVLADGSYEATVAELRRQLADHPNPEDVEGHPVLAVQTGHNHAPARWIYVHVQGQGDVAPIVAIRDDNGYMVGFTNQHGRWFEFGKRGATQPQLPGATLLGYSGNYQSLVGGSSQLPTAFKVGKYELVRAAKALWDHPHHRANEDGGSDDDDDPMAPTPGVKTYLALLVFCLCEGARLPPVYDAVNAAWSTEAAGYIITHEHVVYINHWQQVSSALLGWKRHGNSFKWPKNVIDVGINGKDAGLLIVYLILNKPPTRMTTSVTAASRLLGFFGSLQALWRLLSKATGLF